jgi:hypothetical protein
MGGLLGTRHMKYALSLFCCRFFKEEAKYSSDNNHARGEYWLVVRGEEEKADEAHTHCSPVVDFLSSILNMEAKW